MTHDTSSAQNRFAYQQGAILILFFLSGLSALIYEIIWFRMLSVIFGATIYATTTVLSSFMGGLALGSFVIGRLADRSRNPLRLYGILEIGIGVFALIFPYILEIFDNAYIVVHQRYSVSFYVLSLARFFASFVILILPTALMGGTFPVISKYFIREARGLTSGIGRLYSANTVGAVAGVLLSGFVLIARLGIQTTSYIAVSINIAVGLVAFALSARKWRKEKDGTVKTEPAEPTQEREQEDPELEGIRLPILIAVFISGFTGLAYEVLWTRTLVFILDSFVYSFSIMLSTFLFGIAVGSIAISKTDSKARYQYDMLCIIEIAIGLASLLALPLLVKLAIWKENYMEILSRGVSLDSPAPWGRYILFKFGVSFLIMAIPTILLGSAFPLAVRLYSTTLRDLGKKIGNVYSSNTLGAIMGSFLAGFVLIPFVGLRNAFIIAASLNVFAGVLLFSLQPGASAAMKFIRSFSAVFLLLAISYFIPHDIYKRIFQKAEKQYELVYYKEDPTATVTVHRRAKDRLIIDLNGLNVAGTAFNFLTTQKMQAHLGMLLHPQPRRILQIGFGSGGTCYSVSLHGSVEAIDCVEICPAVIQAAKYFIPSNHRVLENPIVHLTIEDARNYVLATPNRYDIILSDSIHPTYAGNGTLYSRDYFLLCKDKLEKGGFVSFWLPLYLLSTRDYKTIIKTFQSVFPYVTVWHVNSAIEAYSIVIGRNEPITIDIKHLRAKLKDPEIGKDLATINVTDEYDVLSYFIMGPARAREFAGDGTTNSDDFPVIEFNAPKSMSRRRTWYLNLSALAKMRESPLPYAINIGSGDGEREAFLSEAKRRFLASGLIIQGHLINIHSYEFEKEYQCYEEASQISPHNKTIERLKSLAESRVLVSKGEKAIKKKKYKEALSYFEGAIAVNPDPTDDSVGYSYYRKGNIYMIERDLIKAHSMLEKCLSVFPNHRNALLLSAMVAKKSLRHDLASERIKRLLYLYPGDREVKSTARSLGIRF